MNEEPPFSEDIHAAQREELLSVLKTLSHRNEPLIVHEQRRLGPDDLIRVLQKIRYGYGFSRVERTALTDAGFDLDQLYPGR